MRTSDTIAVGSPTTRLLAIMVSTLLISLLAVGAGFAGSSLLAADGPIVVAQDGSGTVTTIGEAVALANDGDTILVRPGRYEEAVTVEADITIAGDGPREAIIVRIPDGGPSEPWLPHFYEMRYVFFLSGSDATVRDLTVLGPDRSGTAFLVRGGSPTISGNIVDLDAANFRSARGLAYVGGAATATVSDNVTDGFIWVDEGANAIVFGNRMLAGAEEFGVRVDGEGSRATIIDNELNGVIVGDDAVAQVRDNDMSGGLVISTGCLIELSAPGPGVIIESNRVADAPLGLCVKEPANALIRGNDISGVEFSAVTIGGGDVDFMDNSVTTSGLGVAVIGGAPRLTGNTIESNSVGLALIDGDPVLHGNRICDNDRNLNWPDGEA